MKSTLKHKLYIYYFKEFDHYYLQLKLHISSVSFLSLIRSLSGVSGNICTSVFGWNKMSSTSFPPHTHICALCFRVECSFLIQSSSCSPSARRMCFSLGFHSNSSAANTRCNFTSACVFWHSERRTRASNVAGFNAGRLVRY